MALGRESGDENLMEIVSQGRLEELDERMAALCRYALKLTVEPAQMTESDVEALRAVGFDDRAIVDANQVASYFNYVNRVVDGLGVEGERTWPEELKRERTYRIAGQ